MRRQATTDKVKIFENLKNEVRRLNYFSPSKKFKMIKWLNVNQFRSNPGGK